jgi:glycosyltransferase involved in cell wall biosynthesis
LVIIGNGSQFSELKKKAKSNIQLLGMQSDAVVEDYLAKAKAFVYAACEDFGIALVEAQACGTPVIAYGAGGAKETVQDIHQSPDAATGLLFSPQTPSALVEAVETFESQEEKFIPEQIYQHATRFSTQRFHSTYLQFLEKTQQEENDKS